MNTLTKTLIAAGLAIVSTSALACADTPYNGNYTGGGKTISVYERERCGGTHVYREWAPDQKPAMRTGTPMLKLFSFDTEDYANVHFKRRNGLEYVLSIPEGVEPTEGGAERLNLEIREDGKTVNQYQLKRIGG